MKQQLILPRKFYHVNKDAALVDSKSSCFQPCQDVSEIPYIFTEKKTSALKRKEELLLIKGRMHISSSLILSSKTSILIQKENINLLLGDVILIKTSFETNFFAPVSLLHWLAKKICKTVCKAQKHASKSLK